MNDSAKSKYRKKVTFKKVILIFIKIFILIFLIWTGFVVYMYVNQEKYIFFPQSISQGKILKIEEDYKNVEALSIKTRDNNTLNGWLVKDKNSQSSPLIIYFGGNADEVSEMIRDTSNIEGYSWALINYRGYGESTGTPGETELFNDSLLIYDYLNKRKDIDNRKIIAFGRSLGTGIAVHLAQNRHVNGLILATPYDSMTNVIKEKYPFLPVKFILKHKFDSMSKISLVKLPILVLAAENDEIIPIDHARKLIENLNTNCSFWMINKSGHNTISNNGLYWKYINEFLKQTK